MFVLSHELIQAKCDLNLPFLAGLFSLKNSSRGINGHSCKLPTANTHSCIWANNDVQTLSGKPMLSKKRARILQPSGVENKNLQVKRFQSWGRALKQDWHWRGPKTPGPLPNSVLTTKSHTSQNSWKIRRPKCQIWHKLGAPRLPALTARTTSTWCTLRVLLSIQCCLDWNRPGSCNWILNHPKNAGAIAVVWTPSILLRGSGAFANLMNIRMKRGHHQNLLHVASTWRKLGLYAPFFKEDHVSFHYIIWCQQMAANWAAVGLRRYIRWLL